MSQENLELQHRLTDAFNRRDLDAYLALTDEDIEAIPRVGGMEGGYHGHDGTRRWWTDLLGSFPDFSVEFYEVHDIGGNLTLTAGRARAHGAGSDTPIEQVFWQVVRWRRGRCFWWAHCGTRAEALEAAGLSEQNDPLTALPTVPGDDKIRILNAGVEAVNAREVNEALLTEDFEIVNVSNALTDKTYRGASGAREWQHDFFDVLDENARFEVTEIVEDREDYLVVRNRLVGTASASGVPFDMEWFSAWWFRDGRATRTVGYNSRRAALAAVHGDAPADS